MPYGRDGRPWRRLRTQLLANNPPCALCGHPGADTLDHIVSLKAMKLLGYTPAQIKTLAEHPNNLRPAHRSCNSRRGAGLNPKQPPKATTRHW